MYHKNRIVGVGILCGFFCVLTALAKTETTVQTLPTEKPVTASAVSLKEIPLETRTFYQKTLTFFYQFYCPFSSSIRLIFCNFQFWTQLSTFDLHNIAFCQDFQAF